ncbi:MAG TPA: HEAT repeat domain-containing protein [Candidatus Binatia bacterium]
MTRTARTTLLAAACLLAALTVGSALGAPRSESTPPRLQSLLRGARTVVVARVADVVEHDSGRVAVAELSVASTIKGEEGDGTLRVVELRSLPSVPPVFERGRHVVAFLNPAARTSYLRDVLPPGEYLQASGREAVLASEDEVAAREAGAIVERIAAASREPERDLEKRRAAERALAFDEIAARHPAVVEDGVAALATLPDLEPLADGERSRLAAAVARDDLPVRIRVRLLDQIATLGLEDMVGPIASLRSDDSTVTAAAWSALRRLGAAPDEKQIARELGSANPDQRAAAARELLARGGRDAIERAGRLATDDPDPEVRKQVIDALASTGSPDALPILERAFSAPGWDVRQAAGRAIFQIGGRAAAESFARLTFDAPAELQRYALTLLRASGVPEDDPLLRRIRTEHPVSEVREAATRGFDVHGH